MTQVAAICESLLKGEVLSIMTGFKMFACSNIPREISRSVEQKFGVIVSRVRRDFVSQYGQPGFFYEYRLNKTLEQNKIGVQKMREYVQEQRATKTPPRTEKEQRQFKQTEMFLGSI